MQRLDKLIAMNLSVLVDVHMLLHTTSHLPPDFIEHPEVRRIILHTTQTHTSRYV